LAENHLLNWMNTDVISWLKSMFLDRVTNWCHWQKEQV